MRFLGWRTARRQKARRLVSLELRVVSGVILDEFSFLIAGRTPVSSDRAGFAAPLGCFGEFSTPIHPGNHVRGPIGQQSIMRLSPSAIWRAMSSGLRVSVGGRMRSPATYSITIQLSPTS